MSIPIILIHLTNSDYLIYSLAQAKNSNPQSNIFLIGDNTNNIYPFINHVNIVDYSQEALEFADIYCHYNTNPVHYELFCFQRWFVLKNWMAANKIDKCVYIDSDVMLYADMTAEQKKFADFDFTLSQNTSPHCVFINSFNGLEKFCNFLVDLYSEASLLKIMESHYQKLQQNNQPGGACDMTAFQEYAKRNYGIIGEISTIIDDSRYDHNINISEGFEVKDDKKNIYFVENKPFCLNLISGKEIMFNALHFQGSAKISMKDYFMGNILLIDQNYVILPFKLGEINLIIFPDWSDSEESISNSLEQVIKLMLTHPDQTQLNLLIYTGNLDKEDVTLFLSTVIMDLLMQENLEVTEELQISLVGEMAENQWKALFSQVYARLILQSENQAVITSVKADNLLSLEIDTFCMQQTYISHG